MITIWIDPNEVDYKDRIILPDEEEFRSEPGELKEGMHVILWHAGGEVEAVLEFEKGSSGRFSDMLGGRPGEKGSWRARILPGTGRQKRHTYGDLVRKSMEERGRKPGGTGGI